MLSRPPKKWHIISKNDSYYAISDAGVYNSKQ